MSWTFLSAREGIERFGTQWDDLNRALYGAHPLFDCSFVQPLVNHFATDGDVLAVRRDGDRPISMVFLTRKSRSAWCSFLPSQTQVAPTLLRKQDDLHSLLGALPTAVLWLDLLCQDPDYSLARDMNSIPGSEFKAHSLTLNISLAGTFEEYWEQRSKKLRQEMRRTLRKIEQDGLTFRLDARRGAEAVDEAVVNYGLIESRGWKAKEGTAIHPDNAQGRFYRDLMARFARKNEALVYELHLGGALVASQLAIGNSVMLITLKTTYEESFAKYSPGRVLDYLMLEREFQEKRYSTVEYYTNASPEVLRWGTSERAIGHHRLYRYPGLKRWIGYGRSLRTRLRGTSRRDDAETTPKANATVA
jgi:hypothetical protein